MPGAEIHANVVETLLASRSINRLPTAWAVMFRLLLVALGVWLLLRQTWIRGLLGLLALGVVSYGFGFGLFLWGDGVLPLASAHLGLLCTALGGLAIRLTGEERRRARLHRLFGRYVSAPLLETLIQQGGEPRLAVFQVWAWGRNSTTKCSTSSPSGVAAPTYS